MKKHRKVSRSFGMSDLKDEINNNITYLTVYRPYNLNELLKNALN